MPLDFADYETRFGFSINRLVIADQLTAWILGPQSLFFALEIVFDNAAGDIEDVLGRAIVLFEADNFRRWKMLFKLEDVLDVRAPPPVYRLIGVADNTDILLPLGQ